MNQPETVFLTENLRTSPFPTGVIFGTIVRSPLNDKLGTSFEVLQS